MSTKIYNAYEFHGTIEELLEFSKALRLEWIQHYVTRVERTIESRMQKGLSVQEALASTLIDVEAQTTKAYNQISDILDFKSTITIHPCEDRLFVIFFADRSFRAVELNLALENDGRFSDYHYQNQTDPWYEDEEHLTPTEYKQARVDYLTRELIWDKILDNPYTIKEHGYATWLFGNPIAQGFSYELGSALDLTFLKAIIERESVKSTK